MPYQDTSGGIWVEQKFAGTNYVVHPFRDGLGFDPAPGCRSWSVALPLHHGLAATEGVTTILGSARCVGGHLKPV